jgi:hypothetical protein
VPIVLPRPRQRKEDDKEESDEDDDTLAVTVGVPLVVPSTKTSMFASHSVVPSGWHDLSQVGSGDDGDWRTPTHLLPEGPEQNNRAEREREKSVDKTKTFDGRRREEMSLRF